MPISTVRVSDPDAVCTCTWRRSASRRDRCHRTPEPASGETIKCDICRLAHRNLTDVRFVDLDVDQKAARIKNRDAAATRGLGRATARDAVDAVLVDVQVHGA